MEINSIAGAITAGYRYAGPEVAAHLNYASSRNIDATSEPNQRGMTEDGFPRKKRVILRFGDRKSDLQKLVRKCKRLKQVADRVNYGFRLLRYACNPSLLVAKGRSHSCCLIGVSGRGVKFFLDKKNDLCYHDPIFLRLFPARTIFPLRTLEKSFYWRSCIGVRRAWPIGLRSNNAAVGRQKVLTTD